MYYFYNYFNIFTAPLFCLYAIGKGPAYVIASFALAFVIHPTVDNVLNRFFREKILGMNGASKEMNYQIPLALAVPMQMLLVFTALTKGSATLADGIYSGMLCGLSGGILGIATAHEMIHRKKKWQRAYGSLMLYTINYPHFRIEHYHHHVTVATAQDPDTALEGESLYRFLLRSIPQGWMVCWKKKAMLRVTLTQVALLALAGALFGVNGFAAYLVQGIVTLVLLKWINYVEHYGLVRKTINGRPEAVNAKHSWDSTAALTNFSLFNLGFHTQHHMKAQLEYHELPAASDEWNELPAGYSAMMMLALVPQAWIRVMGAELEALKS